ncbi:MAG: class I SAM-dependent methyltransferase [Candidatus Kapabacteria bacterium]|nr:class I SAM-dependent methyltransferase [Candidatus Kapabacteria bacterium]
MHLNSLLFTQIVKTGFKIAYLECGTNEPLWFRHLPANCIIDGYDFNIPNEGFSLNSSKFNFFKKDFTKLYKIDELKEKYDLVIADNIYSHKKNTDELTLSIKHILKPDGFLHIGIPDSENFTDCFYRLVHPDGGGHINDFTKESMIELMKRNGFVPYKVREWAEDWMWLESEYDLEHYNKENLTKADLIYIANEFRKELLTEKGYFYGWELLFVRENHPILSSKIPTRKGYGEYK